MASGVTGGPRSASRHAASVLIRWKKALAFVGVPGDEIFVNMPGVTSEEQAKAFGNEILEGREELIRTTHAYVGLAVEGVSIPGLGQKMGGDTVVGYSGTMSGEVVTISPELADPLTLKAEALRRRIERASAGTVSLWGAPGRGDAPDGSASDTTPSSFTVSGVLSELWTPDADGRTREISPLWQVKTAWRGAYISAMLRIAGTSTTHIELIKIVESPDFESFTETKIGDVYIAANKRRRIAKFSIEDGWFRQGEAMFCRVKSAGIDAEDLTVTLHGATV